MARGSTTTRQPKKQNKMTITFNEPFPGVRSAVDMANALLRHPGFFRAIAAHPGFDRSNAPSRVIAELMEKSSLVFRVTVFMPRGGKRFKYRNTFAYTDSGFPNTLFLNRRKLNRETEDIAATIIHESVHALDDSEAQYGFGHGDNSPVGKANTAPYWIGNLAYRMLKGVPHAAPRAFSQIME